MTSARNKICSVRFEPMGLTVRVTAGSTLLEAGHAADIYLSSICGGDGYCGKCKAVIDEGRVEHRPTNLSCL